MANLYTVIYKHIEANLKWEAATNKAEKKKILKELTSRANKIEAEKKRQADNVVRYENKREDAGVDRTTVPTKAEAALAEASATLRYKKNSTNVLTKDQTEEKDFREFKRANDRFAPITKPYSLIQKQKLPIRDKKQKYKDFLAGLDPEQRAIIEFRKELNKKKRELREESNKLARATFMDILDISRDIIGKATDKDTELLFESIESMRKARASRNMISTLESALKSEFKNLAYDYNKGNITGDEFKDNAKKLLKTFHTASAITGAGGLGNISPKTLRGIEDRIQREYQYFDRFAEKKLGLTVGINNRGSTNPISAKNIASLTNYAASIKGSYELAEGNVLSDGGYEVEERWVTTAIESCQDCLGNASAGWVDLGTLPELYSTVCGNNCKCYIERRDKKKNV